MIVATTLSGSAYGISNDNGEVIWSLYLGEESTPFRDQLMNPKIPLYIMRSTNYFQYPSQAAIVCNVQDSRKSKIVFFNPITGSMVNAIQMDDLKRVEMMPFANAEMLHPLLIVRADDKLEFHPSIEADYTPPYPIHLMFLEKQSLLRGVQVDFQKRVLIENWKSDLGFTSPAEKIVKVAAKSNSQKVHSQGKVLGENSALQIRQSQPGCFGCSRRGALLAYRFPAGFCLWSSGESFPPRHPRSHSPVNLVHCENWLVYTYWNVKARRTELGVVELYEGLEQTNSKNFNSYTTLKHPLTVFAQSYIFSQGVAAMAVSETEQGLTTRSVIIAMPFGGVLEMSRRLIDARRPWN
uniref:ER membrane protein complex subunit 1 n=1 Tax=Ditylenchus dipsaci TaxID=166011 RepID=A0A915CSD2_9BILA